MVFMFKIPIVNESLCAVILVSSVVLRMLLLFLTLKKKAPIPRKEPGRTHAHTHKHWSELSRHRATIAAFLFVRLPTQDKREKCSCSACGPKLQAGSEPSFLVLLLLPSLISGPDLGKWSDCWAG